VSELAKKVKYPEYFYYLIEFVGANPRALQCFRLRYPCLAGSHPDISMYDSVDLDEMDTLLKKLGLSPLVTEHTNSVSEDDDAA
jgi:hypothetical protein